LYSRTPRKRSGRTEEKLSQRYERVATSKQQFNNEKPEQNAARFQSVALGARIDPKDGDAMKDQGQRRVYKADRTPYTDVVDGPPNFESAEKLGPSIDRLPV
jgi:hypothetical protein